MFGLNNELSSGIEGWFDQLIEPIQREVVLRALDKLHAAGVNRTRVEGGGRDAWIKIGMALAHSDLSSAEDLWIEWSRRAPDADDEGELSRQFHSFRKGTGTTRPITIGTLLKLATEHGADFSTFKAQAGRADPAQANGTGSAHEGTSAAEAPVFTDTPPRADHRRIDDLSAGAVRPVLKGGTLDEKTALSLMNTLFFVSERDGQTGIFRVKDDGALTAFKADSFALKHNNTFVRVEGIKGAKSVPITKWWLAHPLRRSFDRLVFEPKGQIGPDDYNLWRGFAIEARPGYQKQRRLLRHIWQIICRRDKAKFRYLMRWLAWAVQNPHRSPETVVVLLGAREGSGKSTLGEVMLDIFGRGKGRHGLLVDDKEQLLGRFNAHLETTSFVLAEEIMWAGDHKTADAIKSRITASVIPIEEKFGGRRQLPNRLRTMITTNHEWGVSAGEGARRYFVVGVSDEKAQDPTWFGPLRRDLGEGGLAEFLHLLLNLRLGSWHPRNVPKTEELAHQQLMSAGSVEQWLLACAEADAIVSGLEMPTLDLGGLVSNHALFRAYCAYMRQLGGGRAVSNEAFGKVMKKICGARKRLPANQTNKRPWGYPIPDADNLGRNVRAKLNVQGS